MILSAFVGNDSVIELYVREPLFDADLTQASAAYRLSDRLGQVIDDGVMTYVGTKLLDNVTFYMFRATLQSTLSLVAGAEYACRVSFDDLLGGIAEWTPTVIAATRT